MHAQGPILVCFAVAQESAHFPPGLRPDVEILHSGIGPAAAERRLRARFEAGRQPRLVFTCGFAGGLRSDLGPGQVLFEADPDFPWSSALAESGARPARFHSAPRVATTPEEKRRLHAQSGADAVEMESGVIRGLCQSRSIPSATVRAISDTADEALPLDFNALVDAQGRVRISWMLAALARSPSALPGLIRLQRRCAFAARRLGTVLEAVISRSV